MLRAKLINFEVFSSINKSLEDATYEKVTADIHTASKQGYRRVIGLLLADGFLYKNNSTWNNLYNQILDYAKKLQIDIKIVSGMSHNNCVNCETISFNFNLHTVYNSYKNKPLNTYRTDTGKFLFLGGVPDRLNRIGLLKTLYEQQLLEYAEWSFFKPWTIEQEQNCKKYFSDDLEYNKFITYVERRFDDVYETSKTYGTGDVPKATRWTNDSAWIDPAIFKNTSLSIISEGHPGEVNNNSKFLTEKTYRTLVQGHPFLFAGNVQMFEYIKDLGFKTFENYFPYPNYAMLDTEEERLAVLVENLKYFVKNRIDFLSDVQYNQTHFFKLAKENSKILNTFDADNLDFYFDRKGFGHLI